MFIIMYMYILLMYLSEQNYNFLLKYLHVKY